MKKTTAAHHGLNRAIQAAGSQSELARRLGVPQQTVWYWLRRSAYGIPAEMALKIEQSTGIPRHELRPDLWQET